MNFDERSSGPVGDNGKDPVQPSLLQVPGHILGRRNPEVVLAVAQHLLQPSEGFALMEHRDRPQASIPHRLEIGVGLRAGDFDLLERPWASEQTQGASERTGDHVQTYVAVEDMLTAFYELDIVGQLDALAARPRRKSSRVQHHTNRWSRHRLDPLLLPRHRPG